ncbi:DUF1190 domain-containing protein [Providencia stuartii]|uniref:DUF1190 domain-containing protein n=1 Tax=Providencia stuartii TaxID=588 RepID=UPI000C9A1E6B|nr:DUF1190 domain-containing protein [Providencia stuartii]
MKNKNKIKRKQRKYNKAQEGPELKRIGLDVKDEPRKGANILTLAIMGGAVFLGLRSCSDESPTPKITIFKGLNDCELAGYSNSFCKQKQEEAQQELNRSMAIYNRLVDCEYHYGKDNCVLVHRALNIREYQQCLLQSKPEYCDSIQRDVYGPKLAGFALNEFPQPASSRHTTSSYSGSHYYFSRVRPFYRAKNEPNIYHELGSSDKWVADGSNRLKPAKYSNNSTKTTSRGGFGHKSGSRGG